jgi:hypothetical protein
MRLKHRPAHKRSIGTAANPGGIFKRLGGSRRSDASQRPRGELLALTGFHEGNATFDLPCRTVFAAGQLPTEVIGPMLTDEAMAVHAGFWA